MPLANPYARYQQTAVKTADNGDLLILTYEALIRWLGRAEEAISAEKIPEAHDALIAAQQLVNNLSAGLDLAAGGAVAQNLSAVYDYMLRQLAQANVQKDRAMVAAVRELVIPLLDAWRTAVVEARKQGQLRV